VDQHDEPDTTASIDPSLLADALDPAAVADDAGDVPVLVITRGPGAGSRYVLDRTETRIGRHPEAHILLDDVTVSRRHAIVVMVEGRPLLTDQSSLNGTYVGGERVDSRELVHGDELQVGRFRLVLLEPGGPALGVVTDGG
jgi:pSer/pThr/pTyr-binding forkhead associated (FHA) protein